MRRGPKAARQKVYRKLRISRLNAKETSRCMMSRRRGEGEEGESHLKFIIRAARCGSTLVLQMFLCVFHPGPFEQACLSYNRDVHSSGICLPDLVHFEDHGGGIRCRRRSSPLSLHLPFFGFFSLVFSVHQSRSSQSSTSGSKPSRYESSSLVYSTMNLSSTRSS